MITATYYKQGQDYYIQWNFASVEEQRVLRRLLKGTDTKMGYHISHFNTKVNNQPSTGQMTIDRFGV